MALCWQRCFWLQCTAPSGQRIVLLNLDETSLCYARPNSKGLVRANLPRPSSGGPKRAPARGCCTLVVTLCDDPTLQPLLPQYVLSNGRWLTKRLVGACRALPPQLQVRLSNTSWNTAVQMCEIVTSIRAALPEDVAPVLLMDCASCHLEASVVSLCKRLGMPICPIPPGLTWLLQPADTHCFARLKCDFRRKYVKVLMEKGSVAPQDF